MKVKYRFYLILVTPLFVLFSCSNVRRVTTNSCITTKINNDDFLKSKNEINLTVYSLSKSILDFGEKNKDTTTLKKLDTLLLSAVAYSKSAREMATNYSNLNRLMPCDYRVGQNYDATLLSINNNNANLLNLKYRIDSINITNYEIEKSFFSFLSLPRESPSEKDFPDGQDFDYSDLLKLKKGILDAFNKYDFKYSDPYTKNGIEYIKTDFLALDIPNYRNRGLIAILISYTYSVDVFKRYRIQYISKKEYSSDPGKLKDPDKLIEEKVKEFIFSFKKELIK